MADCDERDNEPSVYINCFEFLNSLRNYKLLCFMQLVHLYVIVAKL
jgi:hypothetical protein